MFVNLTVRSRLILILAPLSIFALVIGASGLLGMSKTKDGLRSVYENRTIPMEQFGHIKSLILDNQLQLSLTLLNPTADVIKRQTELVEKHLGEAGDIWAAYTSTSLSTEEKQLADKFEADHGRFISDGVLPVIAALRDGKIDEAKRINEQTLNPLYAPVREQIDSLSNLQLDKAKQEYTTALSRYQNTRNLSIILLAVGLISVVFMGLILIRSILRQLGGEPAYAAQVASRIAEGDLTITVQTKANDSSSMLYAVKDMVDKLTNIVDEVRNTTESINTASREIAQGNSDLSQRTEQQAANLEETASSMEELTSTVKQNTENAKHANQLAANASDIAVKGGKVVGDVVQTMASISTSSKKIVDIISVIEGIAFQTNILALNAAVEAARAGEQGRGFAVVAAEVRNLAQRSAAAAKEIKTLIDDSVNKVDAGSKQVDQAGETMNEIVTAVKRVTDIMAEIAAASNEQSSGIEEVNRAITQMDDVTQQNAALVEEAAAAAESMQGQSEALKQAVSFFKLKSEVDVDVEGAPLGNPARPAAKLAIARLTSNSDIPTKKERREVRRMAKTKVVDDGEWKQF
ncbi:MAG: methyl-accepting chemotaxis protein [Gallionella sp.]